MEDLSGEITRLLEGWIGGDRQAEERLLELIYPQLRALAARRLRVGRRSSTLETTELVHEAYLRLIRQDSVDWQNRAHFFAIAARLMRRIVVDRARRRGRLKRGGEVQQVDLVYADLKAPHVNLDWLILDEALSELGEIDEQAMRIVELRFIVGLSGREAAVVEGISESSIARSWRFARAWLRQRLADGHREGAHDAGGDA